MNKYENRTMFYSELPGNLQKNSPQWMLRQRAGPLHLLGFFETLLDEGKLSWKILNLSFNAVLVAIGQLQHFSFHVLDLPYHIITYKVLTTTQPPYLHNLISVQCPRTTRSSSVVILARPPTSSTLKITDRSFCYASPCLWHFLYRNHAHDNVSAFQTSRTKSAIRFMAIIRSTCVSQQSQLRTEECCWSKVLLPKSTNMPLITAIDLNEHKFNMLAIQLQLLHPQDV